MSQIWAKSNFQFVPTVGRYLRKATLNHVSAAHKSLGWLSVCQKLLLNTVTMVQKCRANQAPPYLCNLFHDRFSVSGRSITNMSQLNPPKCRLSTGQQSFAFRGTKEYNLLPENIRNLNNISSFKRLKRKVFLNRLNPIFSWLYINSCKYFLL